MAEVKGLQEVEAVLFASGRAMEEAHIKDLTGLKPKETHTALEALKEAYASRDTALFVWNEGTRWKINVKEKHVNLVKTLAAETELSRPVLETLAIIAFRSPVLQSEIIQTRGEGAYTHINELVEKGFITKERFARSYKIKIADKFYHYFDVEGDADIREALQAAKQPDIEKFAKKAQKNLGQLEVVDALDDEHAMEQHRKETQLEIYNIEQQRKEDKKHYLNGFEQRLAETKTRIDEAERDILEQKSQAEGEKAEREEIEGELEKQEESSEDQEQAPVEEPKKEYDDEDPQELVKDIDEQIEEITGKKDE